MIHADPRFTRTSALADMYLRIRTGTDVAYFGGLINYVLQNNLYHEEYVENYTNASFVIKEGFDFKDGMFNGYDAQTRSYDTDAWAYEQTTPPAAAPGSGPDAAWRRRGRGSADDELGLRQARHDAEDPRSVLNLMQEALLALHARDGLEHHRHPAGPVPRGRQDRRRDGPSRTR